MGRGRKTVPAHETMDSALDVNRISDGTREKIRHAHALS